MNGRRRVAVTGMGLATALGLEEETVWRRLLAGETGIATLRSLDTTGYRVEIGGEVETEAVSAGLSALGRRPTDRTLDLGLIAAARALDSSGVTAERESEGTPLEAAVILGTGEGSAQSHYTAFKRFFERGVKGLRPSTVPRCMYNSLSSWISIHFGLTGPNYVIVSACTSAVNAIGVAYRSVRDGYCEAALCGGADGFFDPFFFGVWNNIPALSANPDPKSACRPFDVDRDGCVLGEGAGALVLEPLVRAKARGAPIRGEIVGYGESSDASHITSPSAEGQARAMRRALSEAALEPADIGLINAHGTATRANDTTESQSIALVLGEAATTVPVVANKSYFGHTLGASGAIETIVTLLSLEAGIAPPNLNLENQDPECGLHLVGDRPLEIDATFAMKNSFGFGGGNGVLVLRRPS